MHYYLRMFLSSMLEGGEAVVRGTLGMFLYGMIAMGIGSSSHRDPPTHPWHFAFILTSVAFLYAALTACRQKSCRFIKRLRPTSDIAPTWIRDGLFGGRYQNKLPWSRGEKLVAKATTLAAAILFLCSFTASVAIAAFPARRPAWAYAALGRMWIGYDVALACAIFMKLWHILHLRLKPLRVKQGFEPLLTQPAAVSQIANKASSPLWVISEPHIQ